MQKLGVTLGLQSGKEAKKVEIKCVKNNGRGDFINVNGTADKTVITVRLPREHYDHLATAIQSLLKCGDRDVALLIKRIQAFVTLFS